MKRIPCFLICGALLAVASGQIFSQDRQILSLDDCLTMALARNPFYLAATEQEAGAKAQVREAVSRFLPTLNGQAVDVLAKKVFSIEFPSLIPGQPPQRFKLDFTKTYQFALNFSLPIFSGGRLNSGLKQAKYNLQATKETIRQSRLETIFSVKKAFYGCLLAKKFVQVAGEAVALAEEHAKNVKNLYDVGMASRLDLLRSDVQVANLKPQLIRARNGMDVGALGLKTLLGLDSSTEIEIIGELSFNPLTMDVEEAVRRALIQRPELSQLEYQRRMAAEMVKMARAGDWPNLAIGGAYNYWSNSLNFKKNNWESYYSVNLVLNIPLFNGFASQAQVGRSKALLKELQWTQKGMVETVRFEVRQAVLGYEQAKESLLSQEKNVEEAQEAVRIAELNYAEGLATSLDVTTAQLALSQARTNLSQALYDCQISLAQLERAVGENRGDRDSE